MVTFRYKLSIVKEWGPCIRDGSGKLTGLYICHASVPPSIEAMNERISPPQNFSKSNFNLSVNRRTAVVGIWGRAASENRAIFFEAVVILVVSASR